MARVYAIEREIVRKILDDLRSENKEHSMRNLIMLELGFYTGLRIGDILDIKKNDYVKKTGCIKVYQNKKQKNKYKEIKLHSDLVEDLNEYIKGMKKEEVLINISRVQAHRIIKKISKKRRYGIKKNIGTHSMRKTYGKTVYEKSGLDIAQGALGHDSSKVTMKYIGIEEDEINKANMEIEY